jgi:hypothetical protein
MLGAVENSTQLNPQKMLPQTVMLVAAYQPTRHL